MSSSWQKNRDRASERPDRRTAVDHWSGELQMLCDRVCEEALSPAEAERLETLLVSDPQARAYYLELMQLHASLQWGESAVKSAAHGDKGAPFGAGTPSLSAPPIAAAGDISAIDAAASDGAADSPVHEAGPSLMPVAAVQQGRRRARSWPVALTKPRFSLAMSIGVLLLAFTVVAAGERIIRAVFSHSIEAHPFGGLIRNSNNRVELGGSHRGTRRIGSSHVADMGLVNILVFRLPSLREFDRVRSARLEFTYKERQGEPDFSVDLYGLGHVASTSVLGGCFWEGEFDGKRRAEYGMDGSVSRRISLIRKGVLTPKTSLGRVVVEGPELVAFLQSLYDDGAQGGELAVFRLNSDVATSSIERLQAYEVVHPPEVAGRTERSEFPSLQLTADPMLQGAPTVAEVVLTAHGVEAHRSLTLVRSGEHRLEGGVCPKGTRRVGSSQHQNQSLANLLVFRLPPLKEAERVRAAQIDWTYKLRDGQPDFAVDLYGLGSTTSLDTVNNLHWEGTYDASLRADYGLEGESHRQVALIAKSVMSPRSPAGKVVVDGPELVDFLQSLYDDGAQGGEWVVFRLNADASTNDNPRETGYEVVHPPEVPGKTEVKETATLHLISY